MVQKLLVAFRGMNMGINGKVHFHQPQSKPQPCLRYIRSVKTDKRREGQTEYSTLPQDEE